MITGHGAPTIYTIGNPGDLYQDADTGRTYECYDIYRQTPNLISNVTVEYRWRIYNSGGSGVSSWNELTDKPFGYEKATITRLEEQTIDFSSSFNLGFAPGSGVNYTVYVDGRVYNLTGIAVELVPNEIYAHRLIPEDGSFRVDEYYMEFEDKANHVVKIEEEGTTIKTLDDKFLSNSVVRMDSSCKATGADSHAEGSYTTASGDISHAEGFNTTASGSYSHVEGNGTKASAECTHAEGNSTTASKEYSHAEGNGTTASGDCSHAEGYWSRAYGKYSHAEGYEGIASKDYCHAEGCITQANGLGSHAEGMQTAAVGEESHAEGNNTKAFGNYSHAEGSSTIATSSGSHAQGRYNIEDTNGIYAHIVGNGTDSANRSNAHTLDWSGNAWYAGTVEGTAMIVKSSTTDSTKRFKITVDDSGTISATEVT